MEHVSQSAENIETETPATSESPTKVKRASSNRKQYIADIETRTGIDFSKYQTAELVESLGSIISNLTPWGIVWMVFKNGALFFLLFALMVVAMGFMIGVQNKLFILTVIVLAISFPLLVLPATSISLTTAMAVNSQLILSLSIDLASTILEDMDRLENFEISEPSPADLIRGTLYLSILPALNKALIKRLSLLAKPIIWILDKTVLNAAEFVLRKLEKSEKWNLNSKRTLSELNEQVVTVAKTVQEKMTDSEKFKRPMRQLIAIKPKLESFLFKSLFPKLQLPLRIALFMGLFVQILFCVIIVLVDRYMAFDTPQEIHSSK